MKHHGLAQFLCLAFFSVTASAAPPDVPATLHYQGVLLDSGGLPRTGTVDLILRVYDAPASGVLVYKQEFSSVALSAGVFSIELGPTGTATDLPTDPLTTSLTSALTGDAGVTAPQRFLEVTVGLEGALARTQVLTVPYALRASSADNADSADVALQVTQVAGLPPEVVSEIYEHTNLDGEGETNAGPTEGFGDTDGDGAANFVDPDNDNDGILDGQEISAGSDPNLVTPQILTLAPLTIFSDEPNTFQVTGAQFDPSMAVTLGAEVLALSNVTATSFDAATVGQSPGVAPFRVELPNLESDEQDVTLIVRQVLITSLTPNVSAAGFPVTVTVNGQNFVPGLTVELAAQTPAPQNLTDTSFEVDLAGESIGVYPLTVTLPNSESASADFTFTLNLGPHGLNVTPQTQLSAASDGPLFVVGAEDEYGSNLGPAIAFPSEGGISIAIDDTGALAGLRCRASAAGQCSVELTIDSDADLVLTDETPTVLEVINGSAPAIGSPSLTFDASGRALAGYLRSEDASTVAAVVAHDRDGNGAFGGTNELVTIESIVGLALDQGKVAADSNGQAAFAYGVDPATGAAHVAQDLNGDGDFADSFEVRALPGSTANVLDCVSAAFDSSDQLWVLRSRSTNGLRRYIDLNGDGDFTDFQEDLSVTGTPAGGCDISTAGGITRIAHAADDLHLLQDLNGDRDFVDVDEDFTVNAGTFDGVALTTSGTVSVLVADDLAGPGIP